jgi:short-subunit dehydrogenase
LATVIGRRLTTEGCDLVIAARTAVDLENEATRLRTDTGRRVEVEAIDVSDGDQVIALAQGHGDVDILINNAGALLRITTIATTRYDASRPLATMDRDQYEGAVGYTG